MFAVAGRITTVAFTRALRLVNTAAATSEAVGQARTDLTDPPMIRDATGLLTAAIAATYGNKVARSTALRVPAVVRAYKLYTHTIACFPLREYVSGTQVVPRTFLTNPSGTSTYTAMMSRTVGDLILEDVAYWRVTSRTWDGFPASAEHMPTSQVSTSPANAMEAVSEYRLGTAT
jgi:hypothetical protein